MIQDRLFPQEHVNARKRWRLTNIDAAKNMWLFSACEDKIRETLPATMIGYTATSYFHFSGYSKAMSNYSTTKEQRAFRWRWK